MIVRSVVTALGLAGCFVWGARVGRRDAWEHVQVQITVPPINLSQKNCTLVRDPATALAGQACAVDERSK